MNRKTDEELVTAVQQGDITSYEELVTRYQRGLSSFVMRFLHDEPLAADVVQESLFKVYQVIDSIDTTKKFSTFVFEIAKNNAISLLRKQKKNISLEDAADFADDESFIEQYLLADLADSVRTAVHKLPKKYRDVITLYYFDDLSYEEVSKTLQLPINTVRTHLKRAKDQLKKIIPYEHH